ncbi:uncharacterized protein LOC8278149 [Ricinus communis]|uniref:Uncharacterized protein n=1 Tax=Ricinus communis TaxID=3988 RepID=B9T781_RICCO|nr:uncharacterized protein LOC8278149 [Ricinus communis]EEF28282.1 conserved hypothetical protein [Ricinus communis]|eukprot:XP_002534100.1 uncharacterized protein LOC8278149 [Ricinus communis]
MAGWAASNNNKKLNPGALDENDILMGALLARKSSIDLLQNCDLPPPLKVFSGSDRTIRSSMNRVFSMMGKEEENNEFDIHGSVGGGENGKLEILKALRLSQTRAREAEKKAASLAKENDCISNALLRESMQLFAYRQWVRLLEVQVMKLQSEGKHQGNRWCCSCGGRLEGVKKLLKDGEDCGSGDGGGGVCWILAWAFCIGIAGVRLAFGCRYLF